MNNVQYAKRNGFATASFIISLVGLLLCFLIVPQILGIVFGLLGLKSEKKGMAISGIVISSITFVLTVFLTLAIAIPNIIEAVDNARAAANMTIDGNTTTIQELSAKHEEKVMETFLTKDLAVSLTYDLLLWEESNGEECYGKIDSNPIFEIYFFKDNVKKLMNMRTLNEFVYTKSE